MKLHPIPALLALPAFLTLPLQADTVIQDVSVTASSFWGQPAVNSFQHPSNLVNNSDIIDRSGAPAPYDIEAFHAANGDADKQWHAVEWANDNNPTLTFDLGGSFDLAGIHIWNGNQGRPPGGNNDTGRGVNTFTLSVSSDGVNYTDVLVNSSLSKSPYDPVTGPGPIAAQDFDLTGQTNVSHVKLVVLSNHNSPAGGGDYTGLSEVMFTEVTVPEEFSLSRFEVADGMVTLAFPSVPGQEFDIYRSADLASGFETPLVAGLPATVSNLVVEGVVDIRGGGFMLGDSSENFDVALSDDLAYVLIPADGVNAGREIAVVSWAGNRITLAEDLEADAEWGGGYQIRTTTATETEWIDPAPLDGKAFYKVRRR